jgi:hypothetical protein
MKFLKEELKVILLFIVMLAAIGSFIYFLITIAPPKATPADLCEIGCPIYAPCVSGCKK